MTLVTSLSYQIPLHQIAICTFRRNAADDLVAKLSGLNSDENENKNWISTIHGIAYRINALNEDRVMQNEDFKKFCEIANLGTNGYDLDYTNDNRHSSGKADKFFNAYTWLKNTLTPIERCMSYPPMLSTGFDKSTFKYLNYTYENFKQEIGKVDFCDMLDLVIDNGLTPDGCNALIVDEFQDLTAQQHEVFKIWAESMDTVIIAGDPLQSIYSYWGGTPDYFAKFDGNLNVLETTYRLPAPVWGMAQKIVGPHGMSVPEIDCVKHECIIKNIGYEYAEKMLINYPKNAMHLVRANYQAVPISYKLADNNIIFIGINGWNADDIFLANAIIKLRNREPITKNEYIATVRSLPHTVFTMKKSMLLKSIRDSNESTYLIDNIKKHIHDNRLFTPHTFFDIIDSPTPTTKMNLGRLKTKKISGTLKHYTEPIVIDESTVRLHTIHGSKGLEAETVFLHTGITNKIQKQNFDPMMVKEEARVFLWARHALNITYSL